MLSTADECALCSCRRQLDMMFGLGYGDGAMINNLGGLYHLLIKMSRTPALVSAAVAKERLVQFLEAGLFIERATW